MVHTTVQLLAATYGLLFAAAVAGKTLDREGWAELARRAAGERLAPLVRSGLPLLEAGAAVGALLRPALGLAAGAVLLLGFASVLFLRRAALAGRQCGCFGPLLRSRIGPRLVARNVLLGLLAGAAAGVGWQGTAPVGAGPLAVAAGIVLPGAIVLWAAHAWRGSAGGPRNGRRADVDGVGGPALVVFLAPGCPTCEAALERLPDLRDRIAPAELIVAVGSGEEEERLVFAARAGEVARLDLVGLYERWDVQGTPFGVAIDAGGRIAASRVGAPLDRLEDLARVANGLPPLRVSHASRPVELRPRTRRDVLVLLAQGLALLAAPSVASAAFRRTGRTLVQGWTHVPTAWRGNDDVQPTFDDNKRNVSHAPDCLQFADRLEKTGVYANGRYQKDPETGKPVGGYTGASDLEDYSPMGWTKVHAGVCRQTEQKFEDWRGHCPCNGLAYYKESLCKTECPKGIKCFGVQCQTDYRQVCIEAVFDVCVSVPKITVYVLRWEPPKKAKAACHSIADAYNDAVTNHELRHVADINRTVRDVNSEFTNQWARGCGPDEASARAALKANIQKSVDNAKRRLWSLDHERSAAFHDSDGGGPTTLNCTGCH